MKKILFVILVVSSMNAYAYLDPGSIGLLIQGLLAGIVGFFGVLALYGKKTIKFLKKILRIK